MAVGSDTYADDLLRVCGGANVFADRRERRYPIVEEAEIRAAAPDVVLLPDEPYAFGPRDAAEIASWDLPAARTGAIHCVDGTLVSWYGPRIARAIDQLLPLLAPPVRG
jgi:ABC-type Fe3+-hydroxamate transport system substrate-binding protein